MNNDDLSTRLSADARRLATRVIDEMFANPFWEERFAARGRPRAEEDLVYHVTYLVQALVACDPTVLERYARWLQSVLTTRGMCTNHLSDSFARLARAIGDTIEGAEEARIYLEAARGALLYPSGPARELQDAAPRIAERVVARLLGEHPECAERWCRRGSSLCLEDVRFHVRYQLAYLADAIALDRPSVFTAYVDWVGGFLERRDIDAAHFSSALGHAIVDDPQLSDALRNVVSAVVPKKAAA